VIRLNRNCRKSKREGKKEKKRRIKNKWKRIEKMRIKEER